MVFESLVESPLGDVLLGISLEDQDFLRLWAHGAERGVSIEGETLDAWSNAVLRTNH
jgi:hypothetical protein